MKKLIKPIHFWYTRLRRHFPRWNKWRKYSQNSWFYKLLVLFGIVKSPTFAFVLTDKEEEWCRQNWYKFHRDGSILTPDEVRIILERGEENKEET